MTAEEELVHSIVQKCAQEHSIAYTQLTAPDAPRTLHARTAFGYGFPPDIYPLQLRTLTTSATVMCIGFKMLELTSYSFLPLIESITTDVLKRGAIGPTHEVVKDVFVHYGVACGNAEMSITFFFIPTLAQHVKDEVIRLTEEYANVEIVAPKDTWMREISW